MYRRRRLGALLVLLLLVAAVVWAVTALLGGREAADATTDVPAAPDAATDDASPTSAPADPGEVVACAVTDLETELALQPDPPAVGSGTQFEVAVRNRGLPCMLHAGPAGLVAQVSSGADHVWSSAHCAGEEPAELLLDTGAETTVAVAWDGRRSAAECPADQPQAQEGTYRVMLELDGEPLAPRGGRSFTLG